jgi:hypothetical protein
LILYVTSCCEGDQAFGKTKLNKILFYADFLAYLETGKAITGQDYQKFPYGPVAPQVEPTLRTLCTEGAAAIASRQHFGLRQDRIFALREPSLDGFSGKEIAIVDGVIRALWGKNAREVSELSHRFIGWQATQDYEIIPYETALVDISEPTEDELEYARQLERAGR